MMKHLTFKLPRRGMRRAARRALAGLLCAVMLGGGTAVLADGEAIPSSNIPAADTRVAETETRYYYYWRNARDGGIPTAKSTDTKIPVIIVWNDQYYLRGDEHLSTYINRVYPLGDGRNSAVCINKTLDYPNLSFTKYKSEIRPILCYSANTSKWLHGDYDKKTYLINQFGTLYFHRADNDVVSTREITYFYDSWDDYIIKAEGQGPGGLGIYRHYRHYPMTNDALVKNLSIYNDLTKTGYAVTDEIPEGIPFLLDFGAADANNHRYAIGWQDDESTNGKAHFLYGAFYVRAYYDPDGAAKKDPPPAKNQDRWWKTGDWYIDYADYTPEQWASTSLNVSRSSGYGTLPTNKGLGQRTWTFSMAMNGQFSIATAGTFHTRYDQPYYSRGSDGNCWDQDRVYWMQEMDGGHKLCEGWLWHSPSSDTYGKEWLRYWGGYQGDKSHATQNTDANYRFSVYVGEPQICSYFKNSFTVQAGQTVTVDGPVVLNAGNTITVEDGGVLSISGWVTNNGVINIKPGGKMIVQHRETEKGDYQEGLVNSSAAGGSKGGCINCDGTLIVMSNATVIGAGRYGLQFGETAQVVNYGTLAAENFTVYRDHTIENRGTKSRVFCGWGTVGNGYGLTRTKNDGKNTFTDMGRKESASVVQLAANAVYGQRASAVYTNNVSGVTITQNAANRTGSVTGSTGGASGQKLAVKVIDFDPAEWDKQYFIVPKKVRV